MDIKQGGNLSGKLLDKVAIVTRSGSSIGVEIGRLFAK